ncbi:hypothetical protein [Ottowia testudinis]|uniref:Uncharacterized protein n=1 Tax=Ottowia testudinis TaxID=2816950 RepID=A0A975CHX2_9BURK|nr:hypothetical protein [Ottowia testudinis]QTD46748.1 hypothetical protein J1M35_07720 [Ottowia testudinis]
MRLSTVMAVLFMGAVLYVVMAIIRYVVIGRMEGMQDEALEHRRKAVRGAVFGAAALVIAILANWW